MKTLLKAALKLYKATISPYLPKSCRYYPTCSEYAHQAIEEFGAIRGTRKAIGRVLRCHPFAEGGYDPVPKSSRGNKDMNSV